MENLLSGLGNRVFLMNNVNDDASVVFQTRWALSYLRGPLTRDQIKITHGALQNRPGGPSSRGCHFRGCCPAAAGCRCRRAFPVAAPALKSTGQPPALSPDVPRFFIPPRGRAPAGNTLYYQPRLLGGAKVNFSDTKTRVDVTQNVVFLTPITDEAIPVEWENADAISLALNDLEKNPSGESTIC